MKSRLNHFKKIRDEIICLLDAFPADRRHDFLFDEWSLKDIVAHLNGWMTHDIDCLYALLENREPFWEPYVDEFNKKEIALRKHKDWDEVYREFVNLSLTLIGIYESLPENVWDKPIWQGKSETANMFLNEDIAHWEDEHLTDLKDKFNTTVARE